MTAQRQSVRDTFTSKVKVAIHKVYGTDLPQINMQASPVQIQKWKKTPAVVRCYRKLFKKIKPNEPATFMLRIVENLRKNKGNPSEIQIAYAISISEVYLCPKNQGIQINDTIKLNIEKNLVSFNFNFA